MSVEPTQTEAPESVEAVWAPSDGHEADKQRLLHLLFGPRFVKPTEPGNG